MKTLAPMLATLVHEPFHRSGWVYEEKYDGDRALAYRRGRRVRLVSRNGKDITAEFPDLARAVERLPEGDLVLDGELVVFDPHDVSRFQLLQRRATSDRLAPVFAAFDCLEQDGECLLRRPLRDRRRALERLVPARRGAIMRSRRLDSDGHAAYRTAQRKGWEGVIAKDESAPYEPGRRSRSWLKVKCRHQAAFVIGAFTPARGSRQGFGALLVGLYEGRHLRFVGKVGTGFSRETLAKLGRRLSRLRTRAPRFDPPPRESEVTWIRPELVAEVEFAEWTRDDRLRQPAYLGLRHDKRATQCTWAERER